jgi:hypothetical protein
MYSVRNSRRTRIFVGRGWLRLRGRNHHLLGRGEPRGGALGHGVVLEADTTLVNVCQAGIAVGAMGWSLLANAHVVVCAEVVLFDELGLFVEYQTRERSALVPGQSWSLGRAKLLRRVSLGGGFAW